MGLDDSTNALPKLVCAERTNFPNKDVQDIKAEDQDKSDWMLNLYFCTRPVKLRLGGGGKSLPVEQANTLLSAACFFSL